jgi:hypothetical protein
MRLDRILVASSLVFTFAASVHAQGEPAEASPPATAPSPSDASPPADTPPAVTAPPPMAPVYSPSAPLPPAAPPPLADEEHWYGWQILIVDGGVLLGTVAMIGAGVGSDSAAIPAIVGPSAHVLGGPIVHWAHGNLEEGFASLGLRVGMPLVAGALGMGVGHLAAPAESGAMFPVGVGIGAVVGLGLGYIGAIVVDTAVLAYEPSSPAGRTGARSPSFVWQPTVGFDPSRESATFGVAGSF